MSTQFELSFERTTILTPEQIWKGWTDPETLTLTLAKIRNETLYRAVVAHANKEGKKQHEQMGFQEGRGAAFNQLVELSK